MEVYFMKKLLAVLLGVLISQAFVFAADPDLEALKAQIADMQKQIDQMNQFVTKNTKHTATDKLSLGAEFLSRFDSIQYTDIRALPDFTSDMMKLWLGDSLVDTNDNYMLTPMGNMPGQDRWNDAFLDKYGADFMSLYGTLMTNPSFGGDFMALTGNSQMGISPDLQWSQNYSAFVGNSVDFNSDGNLTYEDYYMALAQSFGAFGADGMPMTADDVSSAYDMAQQKANFDAFAYLVGKRELTTQEAKVVAGMMSAIKPKKYDANNDYMLTNRLRLRLSSKVNENLSFAARLTMYKTYGDSTPFHFFNGTMNSMAMDSNSAQYPTDDALRVERAYFVYSNSIGDVHWHFSFGRRPAAYGYGMENRENAVLGGSPSGTIIQMNFDGASLGFDLEDLTSIPGLNVKFCYGQGYEGGYGTLNSLNSQADVNDVHFFGAIVRLFDNEDYRLLYNWAHGYGLTDGFVGTAVFPFYVSGQDYNLDGKYDTYTLNPNYGGFVSRVEPMTEVGNIDIHSLFAQGNTFDFSWFASYSFSKTDPTNRSNNPMFQFMGQDEMFDGTGSSIWMGVMTPEIPYLKGKLGVEYNHGSKYWQPFMMTYDSQKLATRGDVYEVYYHQPVVGNKFYLTFGYLHYDYQYTNSGSFLGQPVKIEEATAFNTMMPVVDKVDQFYLKMTYKF